MAKNWSDSAAYMHLCFRLLCETIFGSLHFGRLMQWLKMAVAYFLICFLSIWGILMQMKHSIDLAVWLLKSFAFCRICFVGVWSIFVQSKHTSDLADWLSNSCGYLRIRCMGAWSTLVQSQSFNALMYWLSNSFVYLRIWLMQLWEDAAGACTDFLAKPQMRRLLYEINLRVWQDIYGMPNTGHVVLLNGCHANRMVISKDCRLNYVGKLIDEATVCLDVLLLSIDNAKYLDHLLAAHSRGVSVRILASDKMMAANAAAMQRLCAAGVPVRAYSVGVTFGYNFAIIDSEKRALQFEAKLNTVHTSLWRIRGNLKGCLQFLITGVINYGKRNYRIDNYHYQRFFDEWNFLYPVTPLYFAAYEWI